MSEYKRQHYVPQTYLRNWEDQQGRVWIYNKNTEDLVKSGKVDNSLFLKEFYTLRINESLALSNEDLEYMFSNLKDKTVWLKGIELHNTKHYHEHYNQINDWEIYDSSHKKVSVKKIKNEIEEKRILRLEKGWHDLENNWKEINDSVHSFVNGESNYLSVNMKESLINFMVGQMWRVPKTKEYILDLMKDFFDTLQIPVGDNKKEIHNLLEELSKTYFLKNVDRFQDQDSSFVFSQMYDKLKNHSQFVFFKAVGRKEFYTSDYPVFINIDSDFLKGNFNGLYFPISPQLLLIVFKGENDSEDVIAELCENQVRKINRKIISNAFKEYITNKDLIG